ncbi:MAG: DUF3568 family protein [Planctomycetota bacterium]
MHHLRSAIRRSAACLLLLAMLAPLSGCLAVAAATATGLIVAYTKGDTEAVVEDDIAGATAVAKKTLAELGYSVIQTEPDGVEQLVTARTPTDKRIRVTISPADNPRHVEIAARVETFGDSAISGEIIARMLDAYRN